MKIISMMIFLSLGIFSFSQSSEHQCAEHKRKQSFQALNHQHRSLSETSKYDVKYVDLELEVDNNSTDIIGICKQKLKVLAGSMDYFVFELHEDLNVDSAAINGVSASIARFGNELQISSSSSFPQNQLVEVEIYYGGTPPAGGVFGSTSGIFNDVSPSWGAQVTWTLSEPFNAFSWWPCKQDLTDKIDSTKISIVTDDNLKAGSNGLLVEEVALPNNKIKYVWESNYLIDYYLISIAVGPYEEYSYKVKINGVADSLLIQNYIYDVPNLLNQFEDDILETGKMMQYFSDIYGIYPFVQEKYGHCMAPLSGGMEHQTMTTQGWFSNNLTSHELGHQWFGNNVTCATWGDLWLNEGFASYSEVLYDEYFLSQADADQEVLNDHNSVMSLPGGSVFIPAGQDTDPSRLFNSRLTYSKGAAVVHSIRHCFNDDSKFFKALKLFQNTYSGGTASTDDLQAILEQESGYDFENFLDTWIYGEGYPTYSGVYNTWNDTIFIMVSQQGSVFNTTPFFYNSLELKLHFTDATDTVVRVETSAMNNGYYFFMDKEISTLEVDPNNWIINKVGIFEQQDDFHFSVNTGIEEIEPNHSILVSNSFKDYLEFDINDRKIENLTIVNYNGAAIYNKSLVLENKVNASSWSKGYYFVSYKENNRIFTEKTLKQ